MLILVTGASRGIGLELVKQLAATKGNLVIAVSRTPAAIKKAAVPLHNVLPVKADISKSAGRAAILKTIRRLDKPLNVIINNAGALLRKDFPSITATELAATFEVNLFAPFMLLQQLLPFMPAGNSHVVNISSMGGVQGSAKFAGLSVYSASKGALCTLTECLAEELRPKKVSVNCLALGAVQTEMLAAAFPGYKAPLTPSEMAGFIANFAQQGHRYFNGKILPVSLSTP